MTDNDLQPAIATTSAQPTGLSIESGVPYRPWLHRFAILFVLCTFVLIILGGTVTSKGAGLAVPDWPNTFNYNMFLFPPSMWVGGIFWEHTHRLMGSLVGFMAIIMCIWLWQTNTADESEGGQDDSGSTALRGPAVAIRLLQANTGDESEAAIRPWLKYFGIATLIMVIAQGLMGGFRVTQLSIWLAVFHGITAQVFVCMTVLIAAATSRWWIQRGTANHKSQVTNHKSPDAQNSELGTRNYAPLLRPAVVALVALFIQLALGATVRHHGAGLAIPDFPLAYGGLVPPLTQAEIETAMIAYSETPETYATTEHGWYTPFHVAIHWSHRLWAIVAVAAVGYLVVRVIHFGGEKKLKAPAIAIAVMIVVQVSLGAATIWTGRHPEVATSHQTLGAVLLATTALLYFRIRLLAKAPSRQGGARVDAIAPRESRDNRTHAHAAHPTLAPFIRHDPVNNGTTLSGWCSPAPGTSPGIAAALSPGTHGAGT